MRFRLRTLLILLAVLPPLIAGAWWGYSNWYANQEHRARTESLIVQTMERMNALRQQRKLKGKSPELDEELADEERVLRLLYDIRE
jgi:hypothetical protein